MLKRRTGPDWVLGFLILSNFLSCLALDLCMYVRTYLYSVHGGSVQWICAVDLCSGSVQCMS